jgi:hemerythrin superfamily protein
MIRRRAMKITNILMKDHRLVSGMMATMEMTPKVNGMVRKSLFNQIRHQLLVHTQAEEEVFYPTVRNLSFGHVETYVNDAYREHQNMKNLLNELWRMDAMSDEFDRKFKDLRATVLHHVEEEEGKIFPMVERNMSSDRLQELGYRFHNRKSELKKQTTTRAA